MQHFFDKTDDMAKRMRYDGRLDTLKENRENGDLSEKIAIKYFTDLGYKVAKIIKSDDEKNIRYLTHEAECLFKKAPKTILYYCFGLKISLREYLLNDLGIFGMPDLFCIRKKEVLFVEVKTSYSSRFPRNEIDKFNEIKKMKIPIEIFVVEGKNGKPDRRAWHKKTLKMFRKKSKKKPSFNGKVKVESLEKGQTTLF